MDHLTMTRGALLEGTAVLLTLAAAGSAAAQTYPPGTNCQSLLPGLRASCINQVRQLNSGTANPNSTIIPNSAGSATVPTPGTVNPNNLNTGTPGTPGTPSGGVAPNGVVNPNAVTPNGTVSPNTVTPGGTVNPNAVGTPNSAVPTPSGNNVIIPPATGTTGTGTGSTGTGTGTTGN